MRRASRSTISILRGSLSQRSPNSVASGDGVMVSQIDDLPLGLRNDLVRDDGDVSWLESLPRRLDTIPDQRREIIARRHLGQTVDTDDADLTAVTHPTLVAHDCR